MKNQLLFFSIFFCLISINIGITQTQLGQNIYGDEMNDSAGESISISGDGMTLAVGISGSENNGSKSGKVRIYEYDIDQSIWIQKGQDIDGEASNELGRQLSLSKNGEVLALSKSGSTDISAVIVYNYSNSEELWIPMGENLSTEEEEEEEEGQIYTTSLSADGTTIAIGAYTSDENFSNGGQTRIFQHDSSINEWIQLGQSIHGEGTLYGLGQAISLSSDGKTIAIGVPRSEKNGIGSGHTEVYFFDNINNKWLPKGLDILTEEDGNMTNKSLSISEDGNILAIGSFLNDGGGYESGHVRIFEFNDQINLWKQIGEDIEGENDRDLSGWSVSLSSNGKTVAIGAPDNDDNGDFSGHTRIFNFNESTSTWTQLGEDIEGEAPFDLSGWDVSISLDASIIAISAPHHDNNGSNSGQVRVFGLSEVVNAKNTEFDFVTQMLEFQPNPATSIIQLQNTQGTGEIKIYDTTGKLVMVQSLSSDNAVNIESLSASNYVIEYVNGTVRKFGRLVKE